MFDALPDGARVLIVGASRGIGLEFARQLLASGKIAALFAASRRPDAASGLARLAERHPELQPLELDVTDEDAIAAAAARLADQTDRLHLLINCAGLLHDGPQLQPEKRLAQVSQAAVVRSFLVNACGPLLLAKHCQRLFRHGERAVLANLSARVGSIEDNHLGGWYAYRGAKAAQNMFTRNLAIEFGRSHKSTIVVALHPGTTDTALSRPFQGNVPAEKLFSPQRSVRQLLAVIDRLTPDDSGRFFAWDGQAIDW